LDLIFTAAAVELSKPQASLVMIYNKVVSAGCSLLMCAEMMMWRGRKTGQELGEYSQKKVAGEHVKRRKKTVGGLVHSEFLHGLFMVVHDFADENVATLTQ